MSRRGVRERVYRRDGLRCRYCGTVGPARWSLDHIIPASQGGPFGVTNLVVACLECNREKRDRTPAEAGLYVLPLHEGERPANISDVKWNLRSYLSNE